MGACPLFSGLKLCLLFLLHYLFQKYCIVQSIHKNGTGHLSTEFFKRLTKDSITHVGGGKHLSCADTKLSRGVYIVGSIYIVLSCIATVLSI